MNKKATFKTDTTAVEFVDNNKVANRDTTVLPAMVNADISDRAQTGDQPSRR